MNVNLNLDDKRIKKIVYQLEDGRVVAYNFKNGEINYIQLVEESNDTITDREMIDKIRKSDFMDELEAAKRRFKIDKAIADTFPEENPENGNVKPIDRRYSIESANAARKIMKLDEDGTLDKIAKSNRCKIEDKFMPSKYSELEMDSSECWGNMEKIQRKINEEVRRTGGEVDSDKISKLFADYSFYNKKRDEIVKEMNKIETDKMYGN